MKTIRSFLVLVLVMMGALLIAAKSPSFAPRADTLMPVRMLVTVEGRHNTPAPAITRDDVEAYAGKQLLPLEGIRPLAGEPLELAVLIDDACAPEVSLRYPELKRFLLAQPANVQIGIGYLRDGSVLFTQPFSTDHNAAAAALRLPLGEMGISPSPYQSISNLLGDWPGSPGDRRDILVISPGVDLMGGDDPLDPYLSDAIAGLERQQVPVYSLYAAPAGHTGHNFFRVNQAQNQLSELSAETGGEAYFLGPWMAVDYSPYLDDFAAKLQSQYELSLRAPAGNKAGFQHIVLKSPNRNLDLLSSDRVWVPAAIH